MIFMINGGNRWVWDAYHECWQICAYGNSSSSNDGGPR